MSMTMLTILQILWVTAAYLFTILLLPWLLLHKRLAQFRLPARFMAYFLAGNFYCINLVYLLQLLHISGWVPLIIGTLLPFLAAAVKNRKWLLERLERGTHNIGSISEGEIGARTLALQARFEVQRYSAGWLARWLVPRWLDVLLSACVVLLVLVMYGSNTVSVYGYCASDMVVHNYWINYMDLNRIFVDGVYPFGFHCMLYYLHAVFGIPIYVLLRVFALPQTLMIHLMLLAFLKLVCKSRYAPYAGVAAVLTAGVMYKYTYARYYAALPQEYGMLFLLPAAWFAIMFLQDRPPVSTAEKSWIRDPAVLPLVLFGISISLTLAVHFYNTIVAGLLCIGIGVGFCTRCLRWRYLKGLIAAGLAGLLIGLLPMAAAYASGTRLEGSLVWGMHVVSGTAEEGDGLPNMDGSSDGAAVSPDVLTSVISRIQYFDTNDNRSVAGFMLGSICLLLALGLLCYALRRPDYGGILVSFGVFMIIMCLIQAASELGLPALIEASRCSMYFGYGLAVVWSLCIDAAAYLLLERRLDIDRAGLVGLAAACVMVVLTGVRSPWRISAYESNGAMTCLTNILRENGDNRSWTICSANDERQMVWERGYHYETISFLREQEDLTRDTILTIPTDTVYFFVEKIPIFYYGYINTEVPDRMISEEGAEQLLPSGGGITPYAGDARWVTMSRMYYWAEAFRQLYPYEMEVYYETDDFVCYRIRQDGYTLYNFAIDYGYNT